MSELRRDPVVGRWVIISTERGERPTDYPSAAPAEKPQRFCPFCPGNELSTPPEIMALREAGTAPNTPGWNLRIVPNKFPALQIEGKLRKKARGIYDIMNGIGAHEVFIETPEHGKTISTLDRKNIEDLIWCYRERIVDLEKDKRFKFILIFRNSGEAAGASLEHPHSQLIATPTIPKRIMEEIEGAEKYFQFKDRCVFCDMIDEEIDFRERVIVDNPDFVSFVPFAARFPYETWIIPKVHQTCFHMLSYEQLPALAHTLHESIGRLDAALNFPPYNFMIHTSPCNVDSDIFFHWHIEIIPRLTKVAGFEWGTGFYINPVPPEVSADQLRGATNWNDAR